MRVVIFLALIAFARGTWISYDNSASQKDRLNIYFNCAYSSKHFFALYENYYYDHFNSLVSDMMSFLRDRAIYVVLSPYIRDAADLGNF